MTRNPISHRTTSFGYLELLVEQGGKPLVEFLHFDRSGRNHHHDEWECCRVVNGGGIIQVGLERIQVKKDSVCRIPPNTDHWMEPDGMMEVLLTYLPKDV
jgi:mannose-6-phosphate isomerase-like protein (cupin superfamily)